MVLSAQILHVPEMIMSESSINSVDGGQRCTNRLPANGVNKVCLICVEKERIVEHLKAGHNFGGLIHYGKNTGY